MTRIKKSLKDLFDECTTYGEIFKAMGIAKKQGYSDEEVNTAASYRKNSLARDTRSNYIAIEYTAFNMSVAKKFMSTSVRVNNITSNRITFDEQVFTI